MRPNEKLLDKAADLFLRYGVKSISMDDLARELGVSKKTIYQQVENKNDLVGKVMARQIENKRCAMADIVADSADAVDEMVRIARHVLSTFRHLSQSTLYDLKKYYRNIWDNWEVFHKSHLYNEIKRNIEKGIEEGLYRPDLEPEIIARLYVAKAVALTDEDIFPSNTFPREMVFRQYTRYHMRGILSAEGLKRFEMYLQEELTAQS